MLRAFSRKLHLWLGLLAGLVLVPIGLTGGVLVFHDELDAALYPELVRVTPAGARLDADAAVAAVAAAFPGAEVARMELPQAPSDPYEVILRGDGRQVYVNPYTGTLLGSRLPGETLTGWLFELHVHLLAGERGKQAVGVAGLLLLVLGLTGLVLWWRGRRHLRRGLLIAWRASARRVNYDVHNVVGFWTVLPLLVVAFTGAGLVFYGAFSGLAHTLTGTAPPAAAPVSVHRSGVPPPALATLIERAQAALPAGTPARIDFPAGREAAFRVRLRVPGELHPIGLSMVYLDRYSGEVLRAENALAVPAARRFGYLFYPLHIGSYGGLAVRLLYALLGAIPAVLFGTGVVIWYARWRKQRRKQPAAAAHPVAGRRRAAPAGQEQHTP